MNGAATAEIRKANNDTFDPTLSNNRPKGMDARALAAITNQETDL